MANMKADQLPMSDTESGELLVNNGGSVQRLDIARLVEKIKGEVGAPERVLEKCGYCGQWGAVMTACQYCGSPIDPAPKKHPKSETIYAEDCNYTTVTVGGGGGAGGYFGGGGSGTVRVMNAILRKGK